ncbi:MAG: hypothetical protein V4793_34610, partial [Paraburkholderia tropica]
MISNSTSHPVGTTSTRGPKRVPVWLNGALLHALGAMSVAWCAPAQPAPGDLGAAFAQLGA